MNRAEGAGFDLAAVSVEGFDEIDPWAWTAHIEDEGEADDIEEGVDADTEIDEVAGAFDMGEDPEIE